MKKSQLLSLLTGYLLFNLTPPLALSEEAASDFVEVRALLAKDIQTEATRLLAAHPGLRTQTAVLFDLKTTSPELGRRLSEMTLNDVLPSAEVQKPTPMNLRKWKELSSNKDYQLLRQHALQASATQMSALAQRLPGGEASVRFNSQSCGQDQDLHGALTEFASYDSETQTIEFCSRFLPLSGNWKTWQASLTASTRQPASATKSTDAEDDILAVAPDEDIALESMDETERAPASLGKPTKKNPYGKTAANSKVKSARSSLPVRKSRLPSSVEDGFEYRFQYGKLISTFWVIKRGNHFDLMYANSAGSKTTLGIPVESFSYLQSAAQAVPNSTADIRKCTNASMQIHVVSEGRPERSVSACIQGKTQAANELKSIGNLLSAAVR